MKRRTTPKADSIAIDQIPDELKERAQWVYWQYHDRDGKTAKVPINPETGERASTTDSDTWVSFSMAQFHYGRLKNKINGMGFVFTEADPFVGVDIDECIDNAGEFNETAEQIVSKLNSYTELSPSAQGLHVILKGDLPDNANRRDNVEMYDKGRFFTVTGHHVDETPITIEQRQSILESIHKRYISESSTSAIITGGGDAPSSVDLITDGSLIEKAKKAKGGEKFTRLWDGNKQDYDSHSEADEALCCFLAFWTAGDRQRIDKLYRQSGLMREKWDEQRGDRTYGELTVETALSMVNNYYDPDFGVKSADEQPVEDTTIADVEQVVCNEFGDRTWDVTEAALSAHATLLLQDQTAGIGLVITGPSGSGKTTILKFFEGLDEMVYRSDDVTPASFVSHDSSKSEDQLKKVDLLPRVSQKTLLSRDMATWFAGDQEAVYKRMSIMAPLMDGDGYTRDSGSHGQRGYTGKEYRFNFLGASTPLPPRAWRAMGTVGNRLVFHEKRSPSDTASVIDDVLDGSDYSERVNRCSEVVQAFLQQLWQEVDGIGSVQFNHAPDPSVRPILEHLTQMIVSARAPIQKELPQREGAHRIAHTLWSIARGHALLNGRRRVTVEDMHVCGRIALSTMPTERRPLIRALVDPDNQGRLTAIEVDDVTGVSRPTSHNRMELLETLEIATVAEIEGDGRATKVIELEDQFRWPTELEFPSF